MGWLQWKIKRILEWQQTLLGSLFFLFLWYRNFFCEVFVLPFIQNAVKHRSLSKINNLILISRRWHFYLHLCRIWKHFWLHMLTNIDFPWEDQLGRLEFRFSRITCPCLHRIFLIKRNIFILPDKQGLNQKIQSYLRLSS